MPLSRIFVSYMQNGDERGSEVARLLISDLQANGVEVVIDNEAISDESFIAFLNQELLLCHYLIFVQTPLALKSLRVQTAVNIAITLTTQQRMRGVLYLIATPSEGADALPGWKAAYTFDASTDYPRARDKLFLAMNLIEMDKNQSTLLPAPGSSPTGMSLPTWKAPSPAPTNPPLRTPQETRLPSPATGPFQPFNPPGGMPPMPPGRGMPPMSPPGPAQPRAAFSAPEMDRPQPVDTEDSKLPAFFAWPRRTLQTRLKALSSKNQVDAQDTLLEDRPPPLNTTRQMIMRWGSVLALILLLVLGSTIAFARLHQSPTGKKPVTTAVTQKTSPTPLQGTVTGTPPPGATTGVKVIDPQGTVDTYANDTTLALNDNLGSNDTHYQWEVGTNGPNSCKFSNKVYDITSTGPNYCLANQSNFSDFVYQIQMKIVQGTVGGVIFRAANTQQTYYYFQITTDGHASLWRSDAPNQPATLVPDTSSFASAIAEGEGRANVIAISAAGGHLICFVNGVPLVSITDTHYTAGNIGVMVGRVNQTNVTEAVYQYARVWTH